MDSLIAITVFALAAVYGGVIWLKLGDA